MADTFQAVVKSEGRTLHSLLLASERIRGALPLALSIDSLIDTHAGNEEVELCGKLAIVRAILEAEKKSLPYVNVQDPDAKLNYSALAKTWFSSFFQLLTANCRLEHLRDRFASVALVVFNYDRCIEHFLWHALQTYYGIDASRAQEELQGLRIYHPYGTVGQLALPRQPRVDGGSTLFGEKPGPTQLLQLTSQIRTFTEGTNRETTEIDLIHQNIAEARKLVFLGFAFHQLNMELLTPPGGCVDSKSVHIYASGKGISRADCEVIKGDLVRSFSTKKEWRATAMVATEPEFEIARDLTCAQTLQEYWRSLSFEVSP